MLSHGGLLGAAGFSAGGGSGNSFSDDMSGTFSTNWAVDNAADASKWAFSAGVMVFTATAPYQESHVRNKNACATADQYVKFQSAVINNNDGSAGAVLRAAGATGDRYLIEITKAATGNNLYVVIANETLATQTTLANVAAGFGLANGDTLGVTVSGTGSGTHFRLWHNPTANAPTSMSSWDGRAADVDLSGYAGATANSGQYVGLYGYASGTISPGSQFDNFFGGSL